MSVVLVPGVAAGRALVLQEPLSFWGGVDPETGRVVDVRHPQRGGSIAGKVLLAPGGRGSSSSSSVLAESIRLGTAPAAVLLAEPDPVLAVGAVAAQELYGLVVPIVVVDAEVYRAVRTGDLVQVDASIEGDPMVLVARVQEEDRPGGG